MSINSNYPNRFLLKILIINPIIKLDLTGFSVNLKGKWFNRVTGNYLSIDRPVIPASGVSFSRPEGWEDAILFLKKSL
jgi:hypothetical protein